uniref:U-box domain-containing protein n=1 Tax=Panagrolaimus sp. JU765 TaxID=591449 RepID=A0AC34QY04_9BILA
MYPEMYLESVLDFVVSVMSTMPNLLLECRLDLPQQLLLFLCSTHYLKNPFLAAKVVDVVFSICPEINPGLAGLHHSLVSTPLATERLVPSMIKFYADVENGTDFYEKFSIRRSMQVIFRSLWQNAIYRAKIQDIARKCTEDFVRFVNMIINDATYLLDESLANLKKIHDVEVKMANEAEWNGMTDEARQTAHGTLSEASRSVKMWLIMSDETMDMFGYLTKDVPQPFYLDPLGDRVASMLNHNLLQLCGPKCTELKVKDALSRFHWNPKHVPQPFYLDPLGDRVASMLNHNLLQLCGPKCTELKVKDALSRFHWNPKRLLEQIVEIYINLHSDEFATCIAADERSYSPDKFQIVLKKIADNLSGTYSEHERSYSPDKFQIVLKKIADNLSGTYSERFKNLAGMAEQKYQEKMQMEDDYGDDIPDEYRDPIMANVMIDPVKLPSGHVVDRKNILRHLLTSPQDPFSRLPCTVDDLVPVPDLKAEIDAWIKERRNAARQQRQ